uniref:Uncharacterized protein n=1 Tax=Arcella intermedia TaxID=1963864 RepID=A0A6B2LDW6_9EUKA
MTPFGYRPSECVLQVPHGSTVALGERQELLIHTPLEDGSVSTATYVAPAHCGDDLMDIKKRRGPNRVKETNGWLDYVGWYPPQGENNLRRFTSTYVVPQDPVNNQGDQVLFYFIGMQDNDSPNAVNILQPVLTWGNGHKQWYVQSWACCPSNITVSSPPLFGLTAGSTFQGVISRQSPSTWLIDSIFDGKHTTLNTQVGDYIYNWADITLEVYSVNTCNDFAKGKAFFNSLVLLDQQGQTLTPQWENDSGNTLCGGSIAPASANSYYIQHVY